MAISLKGQNRLDEKDAIGKITGFFLFRNLIEKYNENKSLPPEERKHIKKYGKISLTLSVVALLISVSCLITTFVNVQWEGMSVIAIILISVFGGVIVPIVMDIYAFVFATLQVRLNRKSIGIISLCVSMLSLVVCVILLVVLIV